MTDVDRDKYKALFEYMKDAFTEESDRYKRLEDKAMKYLAAITIAVSSFVFLLKWSLAEFVPPEGCIEYVVIAVAVTTLLSLSFSWYYLFMSIKLQTLWKMSSSDEITALFKNHKLESVHLALAKKYSEGTEKRADEYLKKLINVQRGDLSPSLVPLLG